MAIVQQGTVNLGAIIVPNVLVNIIPPAISYLNGVPSNIIGLVGAASWGPLNKPITFGDYAGFVQQFGALANRPFDMGTAVALCVLQGAANFRGVRVSDGTDVAAAATMTNGSGSIPTVIYTAKYSGTKGNLIKVTLSPGSAAGSQRVVVSLPGQVQEVFDNIPGAAGALWQNVVNAINNGISPARGPSLLVVATLTGTPVVTPAAGETVTVALINGTDGASGITPSMLLGVDGSPRTGMYALRNTGAAVATLCDFTAMASFSQIAQFALSEGIYFIQSAPPGECSAGNVANVAADSATIAVDTYAFKAMVGDWHYWLDTVNGITRVVAPQYAYIGLLANLSPEQSGLNKPVYGLLGTQTTFAGGEYSDAELQVIAQARMDVITLPSVGGTYYSPRIGINTSSDFTIHGDNYSRLTPYIARTFNGALGKWVGKLQTPEQRRNAKAQADAFFQNMWDLGQIGNAEGTLPYQVILDISNNPASRVALGYETATANVQYLSVIEKFILNLQGGQSVQILSAANQRPA